MKTKKESVSKSWFCVFNNPEEHGFTGSPEEIVNKMIAVWIANNPQRSCAVAYCVSEDGLKHIHAVFEDVKAMRFSAIKKVFPKMHIEPTKGSKEQAEDYINKRGQFAETGEQIIYTNRHGEIKGFQGQRKDLDIIEEMINNGMTPNQIMDMSISYRRYEKLIKDTYFRKRMRETPILRKIEVYWHVGKAGSGKTYEYVKLVEEFGEDNVYLVREYANGFDKYNAENVVVLDEYRGQLPYSVLLSLLEGYKSTQVKCRYTNVYPLWNTVHIMSILPPEKVYENMVKEDERKQDTMQQLMRRIDFIVYHYKKGGEYFKYQIQREEYGSYYSLCENAKIMHVNISDKDKKDLEELAELAARTTDNEVPDINKVHELFGGVNDE